jgi:hypothetical protein
MLHISPRTVEKHVSSALDELQLRVRVRLSRILSAKRQPFARHPEQITGRHRRRAKRTAR